VFGERIAPNFMHCEKLMVGTVQAGSIVQAGTLDVGSLTDGERVRLLEENDVSVLACGGIAHELMVELHYRGIEVINNVAGETEQVLEHVARGDLKAGYGISYRCAAGAGLADDSVSGSDPPSAPEPPEDVNAPETLAEQLPHIDCIACANRDCLSGGGCRSFPAGTPTAEVGAQLQQITEVAMDIAAEPERVLCRIAELVYFCVEMRYQHVGLAFCVDLLNESETVVRLLRRFVRVTPVCCRAGEPVHDQYGTASSTCNPHALARILNEVKTDLNVAVGLSMGCDVVFGRLSQAPVTTLFVKDKLLANNPVSAVHSRYVLERILART
jgi:uncharacterized metal-binding protein/predicted Fe-Mo cluster-binding NifX family protein